MTVCFGLPPVVDTGGSEGRLRALTVDTIFSLRGLAAQILARTHHLEHGIAA